MAGADVAIKTIMDAAAAAGISKNTTFIITGDHGFVNIHTQFKPNVMLANLGLYNDANKESWKAYFQQSGGSSFLHLRDPNDKATLEKVKQGLAQLPEGIQRMFHVLDKDALAKAQGDPNAALSLAANQGFSFGASATGEMLAAVSGGTHGYLPTDFKEIETGFVAFGKGIKQGAVLRLMGQEDIAPLIAKLLGLNFKTDGILYPGLLAPVKK